MMNLSSIMMPSSTNDWNGMICDGYEQSVPACSGTSWHLHLWALKKNKEKKKMKRPTFGKCNQNEMIVITCGAMAGLMVQTDEIN